MTKEQYEKFDKEEVYCNNCKNILSKHNVSYSHLRLDGTASRCNVCDWFKRNGNVSLDGWEDKDIHMFVKFVLNEESNILNDLLVYLPNKTIEDLIHAYQHLKIGNKIINIRTNCTACNKEILKTPSAYLIAKDNYCSLECYWIDKTNKVGQGKNNICYKRINTNCTNCGKEINIIPFNFNKTNSYGDNHNFCCKECYWEYRSKYYVGDKSVAVNRDFTDEILEKMRITLIKNSRSANRFNSKIQLTINDILDSLNIKYEREFLIKYYALDNYLPETGLMIEVMGDYWHVNPRKYNEHNYLISEKQASWIHRDKIKHSYIKNHNNVEILYLWEYDIEHNLDVCKNLIIDYIKKNGKLENYHSFNYEIKDNELTLIQDIIIPYQSIKVDEYRHLIDYKNVG